MGFSTLKGRIDGISSKMLSETLTDLEEAGLVDRTQLTDQPVRVEYTLTDRGRSLESVITEMVKWGSQYGIEDTDESHEQRTVVGGEHG
jgi:DNA-binding HxlR family transcriptional regulator